MTTQELATAFAALCKSGQFEEAGKKFWSDDIVSCEPMPGDMARIQGRAAVDAKGAWWYANPIRRHPIYTWTRTTIVIRRSMEARIFGRNRLPRAQWGGPMEIGARATNARAFDQEACTSFPADGGLW